MYTEANKDTQIGKSFIIFVGVEKSHRNYYLETLYKQGSMVQIEHTV